jgi:hypothetical protein
MKIALCFSGQLRNVKSTFEKWYLPNVLEPNAHHEIDVFVHSWFDRNTVGGVFYAANEVPNSVVACDPIPTDIVQQVYDLYNPVKFQLQKQLVFDEKNYNTRRLHGAVPQNGLSRLYSIKQSILSKLQHEEEHNFKYDVVVSTRFDFTLKQPFLFDLVKERGVYHPGFSPHGFNVCYAMGDTESMNQYALLYDCVDEVFNSGIHWCDENLANKFCELYNIPVYDFRILNGLNRGNV